jgi:hypothetical protein
VTLCKTASIGIVLFLAVESSLLNVMMPDRVIMCVCIHGEK